MSEKRFVIFNQPKYQQEQEALLRLVGILDSMPDMGPYRILTGYYLEQPRHIFLEADAVLVCRHGVVVIEFKDYYGISEISGVNHAQMAQIIDGRPRWLDNPTFKVRDRTRLMSGVLQNRREVNWPVLGLLLFTHPQGQLRIGQGNPVSSLASGELGIGRPEDLPKLLPMVAKNVAGARPPRTLKDNDIERIVSQLAYGVMQVKDRFPFRVAPSYIVESPVIPFEEVPEGSPAGYRLYRGYEEFSKTPVLVKEMEVEDLNYVRDPDHAVAALTHAGKALLRMSEQHPNIVPLLTLSFSDSRKQVYQIFRLQQATPLVRWLEAPLAQRLTFLAQAARGLAFVHENGMLHRSVNPFNILVAGGEQAKLFNFDMARVVDEPTRVFEAQRQFHQRYVADELLNARKPEEVTWHCDAFSFGVTAFELISGGKHPFKNPAVRNDQFDLLDHADVSDELAGLIDAALSPEPGERPPLKELALALEREVERVAAAG